MRSILIPSSALKDKSTAGGSQITSASVKQKYSKTFHSNVLKTKSLAHPVLDVHKQTDSLKDLTSDRESMQPRKHSGSLVLTALPPAQQFMAKRMSIGVSKSKIVSMNHSRTNSGGSLQTIPARVVLPQTTPSAEVFGHKSNSTSTIKRKFASSVVS